MFFYEGMTCAVCGQPLTADDDVVSCPVCGLPHHRSCWKETGHCHLESLHSTPQQWSRQQSAESAECDAASDRETDEASEKRCPRCGTGNPGFAEFCQHCGCPLTPTEWYSGHTEQRSGNYNEYKPFFASPAVNTPEEPIDGHSAEELAVMVGSRKEYYLPRFRRLSRGGSGGWNWSAFLFGGYWLLYRKMYWCGSIFLLFDLLQSGVTAFVFSRLDIKTYEDLYHLTEMAVANRTYFLYFLSMWLMSVIILAAKVMLGALGNRLYLHHCGRMIQKERLRTPDLEPTELINLGGTSAIIVTVGYVAFYFLSQIITLFLQ